MYTIQRMTMEDHSDTSWEALFDCEDDERRNYKIMYGSKLIDQELTFSEAKEMKAYYESEDEYYAIMDAYDFEPETKQ